MRKVNIGILTFLINKAGCIPVSNLLDVVYPLSDDLYLITGNEGYTFFKADKRIRVYGIMHKKRVKIFARVLRYIYAQLEISYKLLKTAGKVDIWIFFISGEGLVLPMLTAKLLRTKVVLALAGFPTKVGQVQKDPLSKALNFLSKINLTLSNRIVAYSEKIVEERGLEKHKNKISIAKKHFIDFDKFKVKKQFADRKNIVGYIGSLYKIKGVPNIVQAIPKVLEKERAIKFVIGGEGALFNEINEFITKNKLSAKVKLTGWIPHDELPECLNELKLVVLPSYTEGLPNLMLEAMACGTPVLATPVGAIPDMITDGETGFIMEDNSPACIAENVIRALEHPDLERIVENARVMVEREFTYEAAVERYRKILKELQ
jgi:glycosyltransferase involved in cell wall biosynthesis